MSKLIKIYEGMTFSMSTGEVLEHGEVSYWKEEDLALCGGGPSTQTTTSGFATEYKPQITEMLSDAKGLYDTDQLGQVAGFTQTGEDAQAAGIEAAGNQTSLANSMMDIANKPVDLSGQRAASLQQAQGALGTSNAMAGQRGGLGGSRQSINQAGIEQGLAAQFAGIDQQAQQMQTANMNQAMGMQGQGAQTLGMIGQAQQAQNQAEKDSAYTALAQRIGLFSGVAPKEQTTTKEGGK
tara:strand:- start:1219 stop:1932 length:714 start_codon:yes stop_codon:yes gene_type:complete